MESSIIYKTRPDFSLYIFMVVVGCPVFVCFHLIMGDTLVNSLIAVFNIHDLLGLLVIVLFIFALMILYVVEFKLTEEKLIIKYPLRPIFRSYTYNLKDITKIQLLPGVQRTSATLMILFNNGNKAKVFAHQSKKKDMKKLAEHLKELGIEVDNRY